MLQPERLALEFQRQFKKTYGIYPFTVASVKDTKWWCHFDRFCMSSKLPDKSERSFVMRLFAEWNDNNNKLWPYVLSTKKAKDIESDIIYNSNYQTEELNDNEYIKETLKKCSAWCKLHDITKNQLGNFIVDKNNQRMANRGQYYMPMFLFSKSFISMHGITEEEKLKKASLRAFHNNLYTQLKIALQDEFVD